MGNVEGNLESMTPQQRQIYEEAKSSGQAALAQFLSFQSSSQANGL